MYRGVDVAVLGQRVNRTATLRSSRRVARPGRSSRNEKLLVTVILQVTVKAGQVTNAQDTLIARLVRCSTRQRKVGPLYVFWTEQEQDR